jgi:hypothetical protein
MFGPRPRPKAAEPAALNNSSLFTSRDEILALGEVTPNTLSIDLEIAVAASGLVLTVNRGK